MNEEFNADENGAVANDSDTDNVEIDEGGDGASAEKSSTAPTRTVGAALGEITWLLTQSQNHRHALFLADLEWLVMPPLRHGQYRLFYNEGKPVGVALWAWVDEAGASRLANGARLPVQGWRSGSELWLVELIAPSGGQQAMLDNLAGTVLAGRKFRFLRTLPDGKREVIEVGGGVAAASGTTTHSGSGNSAKDT